MIPYEIDPSLHDHEPGPPVLDDGFSAPAREPACVADAGDKRPVPAAGAPPAG